MYPLPFRKPRTSKGAISYVVLPKLAFGKVVVLWYGSGGTSCTGKELAMIACGSILGMPSLHSLKVGGVAGQKYWHGHGRVGRAVSYGLA